MDGLNFANRKSAMDLLKNYDHLAKADDFIEVTEWENGEGWDIAFKDKVIQLTYGELDAINFLTMALSRRVNT